ncbi:MAG: hypothetical protein K6F91_10635 [Ruminococcus sp.]|nr:hypothetical protein [Ruminococcus sp.]
MSNSEHTSLGKEFQEAVREWFENEYETDFQLEVGMPIGVSEKKNHNFDIANLDLKIVIECKRYTWTGTGNVPSAKIRALNEAAFFMSFVDDTFAKYIVIVKSNHAKRHESLAEYYHRTYKHLLGNIIVAEFDMETKSFRII